MSLLAARSCTTPRPAPPPPRPDILVPLPCAFRSHIVSLRGVGATNTNDMVAVRESMFVAQVPQGSKDRGGTPPPCTRLLAPAGLRL